MAAKSRTKIISEAQYETDGRLYEWLFAFIITLPSVGYYLNYILKLFDLPGFASQIVICTLALISLYLYYRLFLTKVAYAVAIFFAIVFVSLISITVFANGSYFVAGQDVSLRSLLTSNFGMFLIECIPLLVLYFLNVNVGNSLFKARFIGMGTIGLQMLVFILTTTLGRFPISGDYMSYAYYAFPPMLAVLYGCRGSGLAKGLAVTSAVLIAIAGCRGALVTLGLFAVLYLLLRLVGSNVQGGKLLPAMGVAVIALLIVFLDSIAVWLLSLLNSIGFTSRSLEALVSASGEFVSGSGRDTLYTTALEHISFIGQGLFGDRSVMDGVSASSLNGASISEGAYVHNWILELLLDFGWFFGAVAVAFILFICMKAFLVYRRHSSIENALLLAFSYAMIFGRYLLSASMFTSYEFAFSLLALGWVIKTTPGGCRATKSKPSKFVIGNRKGLVNDDV